MREKVCRECSGTYQAKGRGTGRFCSLECRFMAKVEVTDTCWVWKAGCNTNQWGKRYGTFQVGKKNMLAHRVSYEMFKKHIPDGLLVCHSCDVEKCVNPSHLFLGTYKDNMDDMRRKGRQNYVKNPKYSEDTIQVLINRRNKGELLKDLADEVQMTSDGLRLAMKRAGSNNI